MACSTFRARHYLLSAIVATLLLPIPFLILWDASRLDLRSEGTILGGLLIITTGWTVIALTRWYRPLRRLVHRVRPRSLAWPPPR